METTMSGLITKKRASQPWRHTDFRSGVVRASDFVHRLRLDQLRTGSVGPAKDWGDHPVCAHFDVLRAAGSPAGAAGRHPDRPVGPPQGDAHQRPRGWHQHPVDRRGVSAGRAAGLVHLRGCVHERGFRQPADALHAGSHDPDDPPQEPWPRQRYDGDRADRGVSHRPGDRGWADGEDRSGRRDHDRFLIVPLRHLHPALCPHSPGGGNAQRGGPVPARCCRRRLTAGSTSWRDPAWQP